MRVPLHIILITCLLALIVPWYVGTRDMDFMKKPSTQELNHISEEWTKNQSAITAPKDFDPKGDKAAAEIANSQKKQLLNKAKNDLTTPPSLSEYSDLRNQGSSTLISLAEHFETQSAPLRALLAWERVLDNTAPTIEERNSAIQSIARITAELPPWNVDSNADIKLILHVGTSAQDTTIIQSTLSQIALSINQASSHILSIDTKISKQVKGAEATELTPLSLWFSSAENQALETTAIAITVDLKKTDLLKQQIELAIHKTLKAALEENSNFSPFPELKEGDQPLSHITRLMWSELAHKIQ